MTAWGDGYVTDVSYTSGAYREMTPNWLAHAALVLGQAPPDLSEPFRYADLGCGQGLGATIVAATYPAAEVWGFDFNPSHIDAARRLARAAGLTNLNFQEISFADLAALSTTALPQFDFMTAHGIMSWISADNRQALAQVIGQRLKAGGLAYISYNAATGWASMVPVQKLMRLLAGASTDRTDQAVAGVVDYLDILKGAGSGFFADNPAASVRLQDMHERDPRYFAHEFLNADWYPFMFSEMADLMATAKCTFIGSATLAENIDRVCASEAMLPLLTEAPNPVLKETLRDFAAGTMFRRDVYRRGSTALTVRALDWLVDDCVLAWTGAKPDDPIKLTTPLGPVTGLPEVYGPIAEMLGTRDQSVGDLRRAPQIARLALVDVLQTVALLIHNGFVHPLLPASVQTASRVGTRRLNAAICEQIANRSDINRLASAATGSDVVVDPVQALVVREHLAGRPLEIYGLTDRVLAALSQAGRGVRRDGKPVADMGEARVVVLEAVRRTLAQGLPLFSRLGVV